MIVDDTLENNLKNTEQVSDKLFEKEGKWRKF